MCSMHDQGINGALWQLHADLYKGITSCVKWKGNLSQIFHDKQGLRQGGLTSADSFKTKTNPLLNKIENSTEAFHIGAISVGAPTCADDTALVSETLTGAKLLTKIAEEDSTDMRYSFSTTKSKIMIVNPTTTVLSQLGQFPTHLCNVPMDQSTSEVHLGITRTSDGKTAATVQARITSARRATYAMMGAGLHGLNGLNPSISMMLIRTYILPRLLHGLEAMVLTEPDKVALETYYRTLLKQIQHLPQNTASLAVYLLIGSLPLEAHLDLRVLSLFNRAVALKGSLERDILERQLAMKDLGSKSWTTVVRETLNKYSLPSAYDVLNFPRSKEQWKHTTKTAIYSYWETALKTEAKKKSTLQYLSLPSCSLRSPHNTYLSIPTDPLHVVIASVKTKLLVLCGHPFS